MCHLDCIWLNGISGIRSLRDWQITRCVTTRWLIVTTYSGKVIFMCKLLEHEDGKMKTSMSFFGASFAAALFGLFMTFGIGGALGIGLGVTIAVFSLVFSVVFGAGAVLLYLDWLENG